MKLLPGAALAALLYLSQAYAQTEVSPAAQATCGTVAPAPANRPDGAAATREQVEAFNQRFTIWAEATNAVLACKRMRAEEARARADALSAEFNSENARLREAIAAWEAEVAEFNARSGRGQRD